MAAKKEKVLQPLLVESLYIGYKKRINKKGVELEPHPKS